MQQAQIELDRTVIRAPIDGTVISRTVDPGQTVAASLQAPELFRIAQDLSRIRIEAQVNEADVGAIAVGNPATFAVDAYPERTFQGKVAQIRLAATELQSVVTYTVIVESMNEDRRLFPGMTANVEIETARRADALRIPTDALRFKPAVGRSLPGSSGANRRAVWRKRLFRLKDELGLSIAQVRLIGEGLRSLGKELRAAMQPSGLGQGADRAKIKELFKAKYALLVKSVLENEKQRAAYDLWMKKRKSIKSVTVWVLGPDGKPKRRDVRIGVVDDRFAEIAGSKLKPGDGLIVRRKVRR